MHPRQPKCTSSLVTRGDDVRCCCRWCWRRATAAGDYVGLGPLCRTDQRLRCNPGGRWNARVLRNVWHRNARRRYGRHHNARCKTWRRRWRRKMRCCKCAHSSPTAKVPTGAGSGYGRRGGTCGANEQDRRDVNSGLRHDAAHRCTPQPPLESGLS